MTRLKGADNNRMLLVLGTVIAAVLIAVAIFAVRGGQGGSANGKNYNFNLSDLPAIGQENAPVKVLVVEDFKCPICQQFEATIAPDLKSQYVSTGKIRLYSLVWPFLAEGQRLPVDDSKLAAQAAKCVYDQGSGEAFDRFKAFIFRAQGDERTVWATKTRLKELAANLEGLDQAKFATCLDTDATAARVDADEKQAVSAGVTGTPTVFVNGQVVTNSSGQSSYLLADVSKAIDEALKK